MEIAKPIQFHENLTEVDFCTNVLLASASTWPEIHTRTSSRRVLSVDPKCLPSDYSFLQVLVDNMLFRAEGTITDGSELIAFQLFLSYYENGYSCPVHRHPCRQITVSLGANRHMKVGSKSVLLEHNTIIYLHGQKHGIPTGSTGKRVSLNLFFTTSSEQQGAQ